MTEGKGSNLTRRILIALAGIPLLLAALYYSSWMLIVALILTVASTLELLAIWRRGGNASNSTLPLLTALALPLLFYFFPGRPGFILLALLAGSLISLLIELFREGDFLRATAAYYHLTWFAIIPFSLLVPVQKHAAGTELLLVMFLTAWGVDIGAYFIGKSLGRHPFFPSISPKKTLEGWIGGSLSGLLMIWICSLFLELVPLLHWGTGLAVVLLGPAGDLVESRFKRNAGVKDSSNVLPGHGGFLDRFDTLTLVLPVVYLLLLLG